MSSLLIAIIIKLIGFAVLLFHLIPKMVIEVMRPKDGLTMLRWQLLWLLLVSVFTSIPAIAYNILRYLGTDSPILRETGIVTSNVSGLVIIILLVLIFNYRRKDS